MTTTLLCSICKRPCAVISGKSVAVKAICLLCARILQIDEQLRLVGWEKKE
mgnify:CR=1 FL=1